VRVGMSRKELMRVDGSGKKLEGVEFFLKWEKEGWAADQIFIG